MEKEIILVLVLGGLAALDLTEAFQGMWSQPLVSGPLIGWILGDWQDGLLIGMLLQLLWMWYVPLGVAVFPDAAVGGVVGTTLFLHMQSAMLFDFHKVTLLILLFSFMVSYLSGWLTLKNRFWNVRLVHRVEDSLNRGRNRLKFYFFLALLISFARGALTSLAGFLLSLWPIKYFAGRLGFIPDNFFDFLLPVVFGFGLAGLFVFFGKWRKWYYLLAGAGLGAAIILI